MQPHKFGGKMIQLTEQKHGNYLKTTAKNSFKSGEIF